MTLPEEPTPPAAAAPPGLSPFKRALLVAAGLSALLLGLIGIVVPGLPTTPFVLLSAACLARSSPRLHHKLITHPYLGPMVRDWEAHRSLPLKVKWFSTTLMGLMVLLSASRFSGRPLLQGSILALGALGALVVWRIPTRR